MLSPYQVFRPYILVAMAAFVVGFAAFMLLGGGAIAMVQTIPEMRAAPISAPLAYPNAGPLRSV